MWARLKRAALRFKLLSLLIILRILNFFKKNNLLRNGNIIVNIVGFSLSLKFIKMEQGDKLNEEESQDVIDIYHNANDLINSENLLGEISGADFESLSSEVANFDLDMPDMGTYEEWCDMLEEDSDAEDEKEFNFLFQDQPGDLADDEEEEDDEDNEDQKNLCKDYRKFMQNKNNRE